MCDENASSDELRALHGFLLLADYGPLQSNAASNTFVRVFAGAE
jgi:hypothetical protein